MEKLFICFGILLFASTGFGEINFVQHDITNNFPTATDAYPKDIDGDGDMDFVGISAPGNEVSWWENDGNQNFTKHFVSDNVGWARTAMAVDIDKDGNMDLLAAGWDPGVVIWWKNDGEENFTQIVIDNTFTGAHTVAAEDMDNDGDIDVLCSAYRTASGEIAWWENDGEQNFNTKHTVNDMSDRNACVYPIDMNDDGHMDVVGCGYNYGDVSWWENNGQQEFTEHVIGTGFGGAHWVHADDVDGDRDIDIAGAAYAIGEIRWWENNGEESFNQHLIDDTWNGTAWIHIKDMDNDEDMDIVAVAEISNAILWWENDGEENFTVDPVVTSYTGAFSAYPADMDGDNDMDVLASASSSGRISWFESDLFRTNFIGEPLTGHQPLEVQFTDLSYLEPAITTWVWDFNNDGITDSQQQNPQWTYTQPGSYSVSLSVSNGNFEKTILYEDYINVFDGESALLFDAQNSYISIPAAAPLNLTENFTVETWIKPYGWGENATMGYGRIFDKGKINLFLFNSAPPFNDHSIILYIKHADGSSSRSITPVNSITLDEWQHVAMTYDGVNEVKLYINGVEQELTQSTVPSGPIEDNNDFDLIIGNSANQGFTFDGIIDEFRVWSDIRTTEEIQENSNYHLSGTETGLIACWQMNEGNGKAVFDLTGNHHGIVEDAIWDLGKNLNPTSIKNGQELSIPQNVALNQNYPNPFNPSTTIQFDIPHSGGKTRGVKLRVYDTSGKLIKTLIDGKLEPGYHSVIWNGKDDNGEEVASSLYFYRLESKTFTKTQNCLLLK